MIFLIVSIFIYEQRELKFRSKDRNLHVAKGNCAIDAAVNFAIRNRRQRNLVHLTPGLDSSLRPGCRQTTSRLRNIIPCTNILLSVVREHSERSPCSHISDYSRMAAFENILDAQISWVGLQNSNPVHPSA